MRWYMSRDSDELIDPMTRAVVEPPPVWFYVHLLFTDLISDELLAAIEAVSPYCKELIDEKVASVFVSRQSALRRTRIALINAQTSEMLSMHVMSSIHTHLVDMDIYEFLYKLAVDLLQEKLYIPLGFVQGLLMVGFDVHKANARWYIKLSYLCAISCQNVPEDRRSRDGLEASHLERGADAITEIHGQAGSMIHRCISLMHATTKFQALTRRFPHSTKHTIIQNVELLQIDEDEQPSVGAADARRQLTRLCTEISARMIERCDFDEAAHLVRLATMATRSASFNASKVCFQKYMELFNNGHAMNVLLRPEFGVENARTIIEELGIDTLGKLWSECVKGTSKHRLRVVYEIVREAVNEPEKMERFSLQRDAETELL